MNDLTRRIVTEVAKQNKSAAQKGGFRFDGLVMSAHWNAVILSHGVDLKARALRLWHTWHPDHFDDDGFLRDYIPSLGDLEICISNRVENVLVRKVNRDPDLRLDDWGDLAERIASPQMELF